MFRRYLFLKHSMEKHSYIEILKGVASFEFCEGGWNRLTTIADDEMSASRARDRKRCHRAGAPVLQSR